MLEPEPKVIHLLVGLQVVANFREAVFHFVPVVEAQRRRHEPLVQVVDVVDLGNFAVERQGGFFLPLMLQFQGGGEVGCPRDRLVGQVQFVVRLFQHLQEPALCVF